MSDILQDEVEQPQEVKAEVPEQIEEKGEQPAPPAEPPQESQEDARRKGIEAALLAERRRRQALEDQLHQLQQPKQEPKEAGPPDPNAYQDNPAEYWRLLARHEAQEALKETIRQQQALQQQHERQRAMQDRMARVNDMVTKGQLKYADFDPVINSGLAPFLTPALHEELADSDVGHELAYYLARNPLEADKVSKLQGKSLTRELTRLEDKLKAPERPAIPSTLTQARDSRGQFQTVQSGPTPLHDILGIKPD